MGKPKGIKLTGYIRMDATTPVIIGGQPDTGAATFFDPTSTHIGIRQGFNPYDVTFDIFGKGFKYLGEFDLPTSGTVKKVEVRVDDQLALVVEKLRLPALDAIKLFQKDDPFAAIAKLLKGNDTIIGSPDNDTLWGGKGNDLLWGKGGLDIVDGSKGNDVNDGGERNDRLIDTKGENVFQFSTPFQTGDANLDFNYDIVNRIRGKDKIYLKYNDLFDAAGTKVSKGELAFSDQALDSNDFFLWSNRTFYYDPDANGATPATPIFTTLNDAKLTHKMIELGVMYDGY